jgi:hypothetical protein
MATREVRERAERLPDEHERQMAALARLLAERGIERYGLFWLCGEGTFLPDGTEDLSGFVVDERGRVFFFWTGWDAKQGDVVFETWRQDEPGPDWTESDEYRRARAAAGLG